MGEEKDSGIDLIFLGGPIDGVSVYGSSNWRAIMGRELADRGYTCYDPTRLWHGSHKGTVSANRSVLRNCDLLLIFLKNPEIFTVGTWREVEFAKCHGIPVLLATAGFNLDHYVSLYDVEKIVLDGDIIGGVVNYLERR